jgi:sulfite dehydrogenase (cytochrome) subunit A
MLTRRTTLRGGAFLFAAGGGFGWPSRTSLAAETINLPFENGERPLVQYPQKRPMIGLTGRPPQLETPISVFNENVITPNDAFFVRYHLAGIPLEIDPDRFSVEVKGKVDRPMRLSLADIKKMPAVEIVAVNQCSGNSRGFFEPRVAGGQLGNGAMGNARWTGVPLKTVLGKAGIQLGAKQVVFGGLDSPVMETTPDFAKALDVDHARDGEVMLAYSMNGEPLPMLNGFPLRLIVPGYYGTYWVKHLNEITVIDSVFDGFWMKTAYRIPDPDCNCVEPGTAPKATIPINRFTVRSFITNIENGATVRADKETPLNGIAFDGGNGIKLVELSIDGGNNWMPTILGKDLGKYSFREWRLSVKLARGPHEMKVRATSNDGKTQPMKPLWNSTGYLRNVVETIRITAA